MIILDTNVVSELMQIEPDRAIVPWLDSIFPDNIYTTSITVYEIEVGILTSTSERKKRELRHAFRRLRWEIFGDERILPFEEIAALKAAQLTANQRITGRPIDLRDTQIAAIALVRDTPIVTRNVKHFMASGVTVINPWDQT